MAPLTSTLEPELETQKETKAQTRVAPRYKVILLNDDITTFEFVTGMLVTLFHKQRNEALRLTREVHDTGSALITVTSFERAELYVEQVRSLARPHGFPLVATLEPE
jgi:ATP-dependent Clp protease adaptor protein ClpS